MTNISVAIKILPHAEGLGLPEYATAQAAGMDVRAAITADVVLEPSQRLAIPTGIAIALPDGWEAQIRPRSGLSLRHGLSLLNSPGTIDADYRGEVHVILANLGTESFTVTRGMRIAQMVVARYDRVQWQAVTELPESERGEGGFGSTGTC